MVSIRRIQSFMLYEEVSTQTDRSIVYCINTDGKILERKPFTMQNNEFNVTNENKNGHIRLNNVTAKWILNEKDDTLRNIDIVVEPGELIEIVGQVGAGKSSLLNIILKELSLTSGSIQVIMK